MVRNYTIQLKPSAEQAELLAQQGGAARWLWNHMLAKNIELYGSEQKFIYKFEMQQLIKDLRQLHPWLQEVHCQALHMQCDKLDRAIRKSVKESVGFPKFKNKHKNNDSYIIPQYFRFTNKKIKIPKIGWIKYSSHRKFLGKIKQITVKQDLDKWVAIVSCEIPTPVQRVAFTESEVIGLDHGLTHFTTTSDKEQFDNPKHLQKKLPRLKKLSQKLAKKKPKSNNRRKAHKKLAKLHRHIKNQRKDFHFKLAASITKKHAVVIVEDLNIKKMLQGGDKKLARGISDVGWYSFNQKLASKLEGIGGHLIRINPANTSKTCHQCGTVHEMPLSERQMICPCGWSAGRDYNAALNIKKIGLQNRTDNIRIYACGDLDV